jgi:hypothetical protein
LAPSRGIEPRRSASPGIGRAFVSALPKNNYGKISKTELRALDAKTMKI